MHCLSEYYSLLRFKNLMWKKWHIHACKNYKTGTNGESNMGGVNDREYPRCCTHFLLHSTCCAVWRSRKPTGRNSRWRRRGGTYGGMTSSPDVTDGLSGWSEEIMEAKI